MRIEKQDMFLGINTSVMPTFQKTQVLGAHRQTLVQRGGLQTVVFQWACGKSYWLEESRSAGPRKSRQKTKNRRRYTESDNLPTF